MTETHIIACRRKDWACALMKRVLDETGANGTAFLHKCISDTNSAYQIIGAFKWLRWAYCDDAMHQGLKKHEPLLTTTRHTIDLDDDKLDTQPTPQPQHVDKVLNTHLMMKQPPCLVERNEWCDNKVDT